MAESTSRAAPPPTCSLAYCTGLSLIILVATVPFLGKAFHIDDPLYLAVARQIVEKPWDPFGARVLWEKAEESLFDADYNPPLWNYCMAGVLAVVGEPTVTVTPKAGLPPDAPQFVAHSSRRPEVSLHLLQAVFVAAAVGAMFQLARRWVRWPLAATALVTLSPAMLPGMNVMLEGPVMAFWLWAVWCHLRAIETNAQHWTWAAGVLTALGVMTKYTSGLVIVLLALYSIRARHWRSLWFLVPPLLALLLWSLHNGWLYERLHVLVILGRSQTGERIGSGISSAESWGRLLATFRTIGATSALALPVLAAVGRRWGTWVVLLLAVASGGVGWLGEWDMSHRLADRGQHLQDAAPAHAIAFGALGAFTMLGLVLVAARGRRHRIGPTEINRTVAADDLFLWTWVVVVLAFGIFATPFLAVRHLLPAMPPLVWLTLRRLDDGIGDRARWIAHAVVAATTLVTTTCGFLVAKADYDFANWYRHMAVDVASRTAAAGRTVGHDVWFTGHWGWAYYSERVGMRPFLPQQPAMNDGDFLLLPLIQTWDPIPKELHPRLRKLQIFSPPPRLLLPIDSPVLFRVADVCLNSVRSISTEVHYYSGGTLNLPWQFSRKPLDDFVVYEFVAESKER